MNDWLNIFWGVFGVQDLVVAAFVLALVAGTIALVGRAVKRQRAD